ncbi:reprolysin-like metallopeptidase [Gelidibacter sp.]|uniref:zinc-dependent metalloprotease n=1 Tax=Gelidibacter sp. TaxID=2018083 RepID=UPI003267D557
MKNKYLKSSVFLVMIFAFSMTFGQQGNSPWAMITKNSVSQEKVFPQESKPSKATYYQLDMSNLKSKLQNVPERTSGMQSKALLDFPNADGSMEVFRIMDYSVMAPELQAKFPEIRSYVGYSLKNPSTVIYFSVSSEGLHTMTMSMDKGTEFVNPYATDGVYKAFSRRDIPVSQNLFECGFIEDNVFNRNNLEVDFTAARNANDGTTRTFRLAVGTSIEYTNFHGGTVASALAAINTTMTRVNGIYDRELSMRMTLVPNNDLLISTTGNSLFSNGENISATTGIINGLIGATSYDIGHTFTTGSGGSAYLGSACANNKGAGTTGLTNPAGDPFSIDYVAHEIGHQFGATHTFNGTAGNCSGGNRSSETAYEPGSGSTIMAYAGICSPQNVQNNSSDYFHQASLRQIWTSITVGTSTCAVLSPNGNTAPTANAGGSYSLPISTPYKLTGASTDVDGTATHTYTWEEFDLGPAGMPATTTEFGPMVRSFQGTGNRVRYIPRLPDVIANGGILSTWEKLPSVGRVLNFVLTVRDNDPRGGQTAVDAMKVTAVASAGPFKVTSQTSNVTWEVGANKTVTWDVANTNVAPINTSMVNINLSIDGGVTFPYTLASNVANDGAHQISVPSGTVTTKARIMVESVGNIFYNVNTSDFKIINVDFLLNFSNSSVVACQPNNAVYNFTYNTYQGFNQSATFSATNLPAGTTATFSPASAIANGTPVTMTVSNMGNATPGSYTITATGTSGTKINSSAVLLEVFNGTIAAVPLLTPTNGADGLYKDVTLTWGNDINVEEYMVEISTTSNFNTLLESHTTAATSHSLSLAPATVYYWRVKALNQCSTGTTSAVYSFSTGIPTCGYSFTATDTPIVISAEGSNTYTSTIAVKENLPITDVNVKVNITHSLVSDLRLILISPSGAQVILTENNGGFFDANFTNTIFDQEAATSITSVDAPFTGSFKPEGDLSILYGEMSAGNWKLQVTDAYNVDGGSINEFTLEFCLSQPLFVEKHSFEAFDVFPNPNNGDFTVKLKSYSGAAIKIDIYDMRGRKLFENSFKNPINFREVIRLDNAPSGMYVIHISDGLRSVTKKILVK